MWSAGNGPSGNKRRFIVQDTSKDFSILNKGLSIDGKITAKGKLIIKGSVTGTLVGEEIIISEEGEVRADTEASRMTIGGIFEGNVSALEDLIILSTGNCAGKVACNNLVVEAGGILNAEVSSMLKPQDSKSNSA